MANDINRSIKIYIDSTEAGKSVKGLEDKIISLRKQIAELDKSDPQAEAQAKKLQNALKNSEAQLYKYNQSIQETERVLKNLSGATYKELLAVKRRVQEEVQRTARGTEEYNRKLEQLKRVTAEATKAQNEMRTEVGCQATPLGRVADGLNKYIGLIGTAVAALGSFGLGIEQANERLRQLEESQAGLQALTGLDEGSIGWLTEQARLLSTQMTESGVRIRQSSQEILEAFQLVGSAKPELLQDREALAAVTEQALTLAAASGMELKDAVEAVTLALNQYGAGADETARYVNALAAGSKYGAAAVESQTKALRNAGVAAASANITIEQTVGLIETLAEKGIKDEVAGTGLKKFFLTLQTGADETNPKVVGLATALENLAKQQLSATEIKNQFGEEGYNVASVLISEAERAQQLTAAVTGTSVAIEQAAINSDTAAARLVQLQNRVGELAIQLARELQPATSTGIELLSETVSWLSRNIGLIATLATTLAAYTVAVKAHSVAQELLAGRTAAATAAQLRQTVATKAAIASTKLLAAAHLLLTGHVRTAMLAMRSLLATLSVNPIVAAGVAVTALAAGIYKLATRTNEAKEAANAFLSTTLTEQRALDKLYTAITRTGDGMERRSRLIQEFNSRYGEYLPNLLSEQATLEEIRQAYEGTVRAMREQIALKTLNEKSNAIEQEGLERKAEALNDVRRELSALPDSVMNEAMNAIVRQVDRGQQAGYELETVWKAVMRNIREEYFGGDSASLPKQLSNQLKDYIEEVYATAEKVKAVKRELSPFLPDEQGQPAIYAEAEVVATRTEQTVRNETGETDKERADRYKRQLSELETYLTEQRTRINQDYLERKIDRQTYDQQLADLELEALSRKMAIYELDSDQQQAVLEKLQQYKIKILDKQLELEKENAEAIRKVREQAEQRRIDSLNEELQRIVAINTDHQRQEYQQQLQHAQQLVQLTQGFSGELGNLVGSALTGNKDMVKSALQSIISTALDALKLQCEIAVAGATMLSLAQADSVLTFGAAGLARAAVLAGLIEAAFGAVKAVVNGLIGGIGSGISSADTNGSTSEGQQTGQRVAVGFATGGYTGDGSPLEVAGVAHRGEYVVPSFVLSQPVAMDHVSALEALRRRSVSAHPLPRQGFAQGGYTGAPAQTDSETNRLLAERLDQLSAAIETLTRTPIKAYTVYSELQKTAELYTKSKRIGGKR